MKFDDLFNEFFKKPKATPLSLESELEKIMKSIMNVRKVSSEEEQISSMYDSLGEPDEIEEMEEDGLTFQKLVWHRPEGHFVKIVVTGTPSGSSKGSNEKMMSLEEQLQEALDVEDYELAIKLRDKIKQKNAK